MRCLLGLVLTVWALAVLLALSPSVPSSTRGGGVVNRLSLGSTAAANPKHNIQTVFIILMENHNWTGGSPANTNIKGNR